MEETKVRDSNTKTQLSLAAALFFSPLVNYMLKTNNRDISINEKQFITWYIKFWYFNLFLGVVVLITGILQYTFVSNVFDMLYTVSIFVLLFLLLISVVSILSDISLLQWSDKNLTTTESLPWDKSKLILTYLPLYNIYLWYRIHNFTQPNRRIKESIFLRILFFLVSITGTIRWSSIVLLLIIIRIASLMSDIDIVDIRTKRIFNKLFTKNPEEIRWYVVWFFSYLLKSLIHLVRPSTHYSLDTEIDTAKASYSRIIDITKHTSLIGEYILWLVLIWWIIYLLSPDFTVRTYYAWFWLLVMRYIIMLLQLKHLPHFPIAREILLLIKGIGKLFIRNP